MKVSVIVTAAGSGERAKRNKNKVLCQIGDRTVLEKAVLPFLSFEEVFEVIITSSQTDFDEISFLLSFEPKIKVVVGGKSRAESVFKGLKQVSGDIVLIHDGARPFITEEVIARVIEGAKTFGSAIPVVDATDTMAIIENGEIAKTGREHLKKIQTPQGFKTELIKSAYEKIENFADWTDETSIFCKFVAPCHFVLGDRKNEKLTFSEDFEKLTPFRVGTGFDLHRLVENRKLILGGIEIPHEKGLLGHSDADVLTHAVMDAILSALSLRDIGYHFPDTDPKYKGISSILLLKEVLKLIDQKGYEVNNVSACIMAQKPKLKPFIDQITKNLADNLGVEKEKVGIGCTTLEGIGIVGREEGIAVQAYVSLVRL